MPWSQAGNADGVFKPYDEIKRLYEAQGVTADKDVIAYCRIGERSSFTWFVLKYLLGYPKVRNYDGSWTEWVISSEIPSRNQPRRHHRPFQHNTPDPKNTLPLFLGGFFLPNFLHNEMEQLSLFPPVGEALSRSVGPGDHLNVGGWII